MRGASAPRAAAFGVHRRCATCSCGRRNKGRLAKAPGCEQRRRRASNPRLPGLEKYPMVGCTPSRFASPRSAFFKTTGPPACDPEIRVETPNFRGRPLSYVTGSFVCPLGRAFPGCPANTSRRRERCSTGARNPKSSANAQPLRHRAGVGHLARCKRFGIHTCWVCDASCNQI